MIAPVPKLSPFGIYVHIPYCARICPYCDFNVYARRQSEFPSYVDALLHEIDIAATRIGNRVVATIFIGGGTPSILEPDQIHRILDRLGDRFRFERDPEISMEANPEGLSLERLIGYRQAGVNRLSIGVQTQQQHGLKVLGRAHRPDVPIAALSTAREAGFDNLSLDFIYGWPGQREDDWKRDLEFVLEKRPEHVSLYSLIIEPGTPYQTAVDRGVLIPVDDDRTSGMYELALDALTGAGWDHYELSNWAREPRYRSRHNLIYWTNGEYLALGAGAHGHLTGERYSNIRLPEKYMASVASGNLPVAEREAIDQATAISESMMLGLRLVQDGVSPDAFYQRHGFTLDGIYGETITYLTEIGVLERTGRSIRLTRRGLLIANEVAERFLDPLLP